MARALWSGVLSFGLVTIPVKLVVAVRDRSIRFNMLTPDGTCRLRQKLHCPETGREYDFRQAARGFEVAPDQYVLIDDKELRKLRPEAGRSISIVQFAPLAQIAPIYFDRSYYLVPDEAGAGAYALLVGAMQSAGKVAIARFVMREREHLAAITVREAALVVHTLHYDDEVVAVRELGDLGKAGRRAAREVAMAEQLVEALSAEFDPSSFRDEFRVKLRKAIQSKAAGRKIVQAASQELPRMPSGGMMDALRRSLEEAEAGPSRAAKRRTQPGRRRPKARAR